MKLAVLVLASSLAALAQGLPSSFTAFGGSFSEAGAAAWSSSCTRIAGDKTYGCVVTDNSGRQSATRAGLERVVWQPAAMVVTIKGDYGVGSGGNGSVGGSYGAGGSVVVPLAKLGPRFESWSFVFSASASQSNVSQFVQSNHGIADFKALGRQAIFRFGFGKGWGK